jgi:alpha 1,3-glucosidase
MGKLIQNQEVDQFAFIVGASSIGFDISFPGSKNVYGIPEHTTSFSLKATRGPGASYSDPYRLYNLDVFEYILDSPMALYGAVPFMLSHKKDLSTGVFWLNSAEMWIDVEIPENGQVSTHWMAESGLVDLFFFLGPTQEDVFDSYTALTGRPQLPQKFAIAYHQCRWNYNTEQDALDVDINFDENSIPYDVLWLDIEHTDGKRYFTWDYNKFPNPSKMQTILADKGRKMVTIIDPHLKKDDGYYISKKAHELDIFIKNKDGSVYQGWCWPGDSNWLDYSNPKAREFWAEQFKYSNYKDSTPSLYTWNDMNEVS